MSSDLDDFDEGIAMIEKQQRRVQTSDVDVDFERVDVSVSEPEAQPASTAVSTAPSRESGVRKPKRRSRLLKREKLKITFFWILLVVCVIQWLAIVGVVVSFEYALDVVSVTEPKWLAWDISPGAFVGCRSLPPQLYGSFGPTELQFWNISSGAPQPITEEIAGPLAGDWLIDEVVGTPNGVTLIRYAHVAPFNTLLYHL